MGVEEVPQQLSTFVGQYAAQNVRSMVQPPIAYDVPQRSDCAGFVVVSAEDQSVDPRQDEGTAAHGARLQRDGERAAREPPGTEPLRRSAQRQHLGVSGWVGVGLSRVCGAGQLIPVRTDYHRTDRYVVRPIRLTGDLEGSAYQRRRGRRSLRRAGGGRAVGWLTGHLTDRDRSARKSWET